MGYTKRDLIDYYLAIIEVDTSRSEKSAGTIELDGVELALKPGLTL